MLAAQSRHRGDRRIRLLPALCRGDDLPLRGPDAHPHVRRHDRPEHAAEVDRRSAEAESGEEREEGHGRRHHDEAEDEVNLGLRDRLCEGVVHREHEDRDEDGDAARPPRLHRRVLEHEARVVVDEAEHHEAGDPRPGRAPAEYPERAGHQLGNDFLLRVRVHRGNEVRVHEVEEPEKADPEDARDDVPPPEQRLEKIHAVHENLR